MTAIDPNLHGWHALVAVLPIVTLLWLMVGRGWGAARSGPVALILSVVLALTVFGSDVDLIARSQAKGALLSIWVLTIIWAALFLFHLVDDTGRIAIIGAALARLAPGAPLQVLLLAWTFTSFLQGIAGYGVPVAVVAPLMVGAGFAPAVAVIATSIGHSWSVTFGSLAASYQALAGVTGLGGDRLAVDTAVMLGVACLLCGAGAVMAYGGRKALASVAAPLLVVALLMSCVQLGLAAAGAYSLASFAAGATGLVALAAWGRLRLRRTRAPAAGLAEPPAPAAIGLGELLRAFAPYIVLIAVVLLFTLVSPIHRVLNAVTLELAFPASATSLGWVNEATDSYRTLAPFGDTGSLLLYAAVLGYFIYRVEGLIGRGGWCRAARRTVSGATTSSIGVVTMVGMALAMTDSGMTYALASGLTTAAGAFFPMVAPFIGVLGAFMTGSNTNSNILFGALQRDTARLLGVAVTPVLAAQTAGGAIGSMLSPAKIVVGASTVGLAGQEGPVLRAGVRYGLAIAAVLGGVAMLWTRLA